MNKRTLRWGMKLSIPVNLLFLLAVWLDYSGNASRWMWPLLFLYGAFLLLVLLLFFSRPHQAVAVVAEPAPAGDEPARLTISERP